MIHISIKTILIKYIGIINSHIIQFIINRGIQKVINQIIFKIIPYLFSKFQILSFLIILFHIGKAHNFQISKNVFQNGKNITVI